MNGKRTAIRRFFFAGGEQKPRRAVRVRKKVAVIFYQKRKTFQRRGRDILAARTQKAACLPVVGDRPFCCFSEAE